MPVPSSISDLSQTAGSNSPAGSESPATTDDYLRQYGAFLAQIRDGKGYSSESDVASAATTDIGAANTFMVRVTGTADITSLGANYSGPRFLRFAGALNITHNASSLILPGGTSLTTHAGFSCVAVPVGNPASGWQIVATPDGTMVGEVKMHAGTSVPGGWLACNGAAVSRTTYAALFAVIGTAYGAGDGSSTFNVPNMVDRMPIGAGSLYANGATGGSKDAASISHSHTFSGVTGGQSQSHTHGVTDPGHVHTYNTPGATQSNGGALGNADSYINVATSSSVTGITLGSASQDHNHAVTGSTSTDGASGTGANLPPYLGVRFIIKA